MTIHNKREMIEKQCCLENDFLVICLTILIILFFVKKKNMLSYDHVDPFIYANYGA